jgi:anti-sigma factor RsiW
MNCADIHELSPLWHSGELEPERRQAFDAHTAACSDCAAELRDQWANDERLREAIASEPADTSILERNVMAQIRHDWLRRWVLPAAAVAAAVIAAFVLVNNHRHHVADQAAFAKVLSDAARDHTFEIVKGVPRRWRTDPLDIAMIENIQGVSDADVKALEATGYKLQRAKICRLGGTPYMHLVYAKDDREFSVYMKARGNAPDTSAESTSGNLQLAGFSGRRVQTVIVGDAPKGECAKFAHDVQALL